VEGESSKLAGRAQIGRESNRLAGFSVLGDDLMELGTVRETNGFGKRVARESEFLYDSTLEVRIWLAGPLGEILGPGVNLCLF
jgi:hypothetical protein